MSERQMRINGARVECCLLSNQTVCLVCLICFLFMQTKEEFGKKIWKKTAGCGIFLKKERLCGIRTPPLFIPVPFQTVIEVKY